MPQPSTKRSLLQIVGALAAAGCVALVSSQEGLRTTPYKDSNGIWTVCYGQTGVAMHAYSTPECKAMLAGTLALTANQVADVTPNFSGLPDGVKIAVVSFTYNVGIGDYTNSTLRRDILSGNMPAGCEAIMLYAAIDGGKKQCKVRGNNCYGVYLRRQAERNACNDAYANRAAHSR